MKVSQDSPYIFLPDIVADPAGDHGGPSHSETPFPWT